MKIYLIRHGQTDMNKEHRVQGRSGLPLNEAGINQAKELSKKLKGISFDVVYSSPQERAIQTAFYATNINPVVDDRLDVFDLGSANGIKAEELKTIRNGLMPDPSVYTNVETYENYTSRIYSFMEELISKYKDKDVNILVCGHKCTTGCISAYVEGMPEDGNFLHLSSSNAECKILEI